MWASVCEANHLSPQSRQIPPSRRATVCMVAMSEPPVRSVMNCAPFHRVARSVESIWGRSSCLSASEAEVLITWMVASVMLSGHIMPASD